MVYTTKNMEGIVSWWQREDGLFAHAEVLLIVSTILFAIQVVCGWWRRCSSNVIIKYSLWLAYTCTPLVGTYTLGFINSYLYAVGHNFNALPKQGAGIFVTWSLLLVSMLGNTYSMTAYDVDDNKQYMRHLVQHALYVVNIVVATTLFMDNREWFKVCISSILLFVLPRMVMAVSGMKASSSSDKESLYLQDYMKNEHLKSSGYDPMTLEGYNYIIIITMNLGSSNPVKVTVSQVFRASNKGVLGGCRGSDDTRLKEVCLSYALFRLLRRRFFGAACPEATLPKTHDLVFQGLLSNVEENYQAAYRVIETELAFSHDHFFTTSPCLGCVIIMLGIIKIAIYLLVVPSRSLLAFWSGEKKAMIKDKHYIVTLVIMLVLLALELLQLYFYLSSDHARVILASWPIQRKGISLQILRVCNKLPQLFGCWQNKIGQHSLLKDLHSRSITTDVSGSLSFLIFDKYLSHPSAFPRGILNPGVKDPDRVPLTCPVKKAIARTLKSSGGHLSNGSLSLERNGQVELSEEFLLGSHAGDMLIWHVATEYCDISKPRQTTPQQNRNMSDGQPPAQNQPASQDVNIFDKGIQLGKRLEGITDDGRRWKILADFWTEMILYIAPSDNARDHVRYLANGGECLTHLWALLTHAGILQRDQQNVVDVQNAGAHQPHQEQAQGLQPDQPHTEDTQNAVNLHEIEEEEEEAAAAGGGNKLTEGQMFRAMDPSVQVDTTM
ncbi:hypothetical protein C2845_PM03G18150 [Panicum miliaceum]|uniref:DUF4220 domain-containing protein n=1 Tax=Panicum miliaceum TaxID=4540 RepID=A0A3L6T8V4_PANMI|nr:hypothetical protein C2845_PM03G18150 [Panicum miliaceum]